MHSPRRMVTILALLAGSIMAVHVLTIILAYGFERDHVFGLRELFDVDRERNVPAIFSICILLIASAILAVIASRQKPGARPSALKWAGLSVVFLYLAADEGIEIHEKVGHFTSNLIGAGDLAYYAWLIPYAIFGLIFFLMYRRFLWELPRDTRKGFLIAAALFVGGAFGTEFLAGIYVYFFRTEETLGYDLLSALEEALEMAGVIYLIYTLTRYMSRQRAGNEPLADPSS
jgi:hypothetical protein